MSSLTSGDVDKAAQALYEAEAGQVQIDPVSARYPGADLEDAYRIASAVTRLKLQAGRRIKGRKIGLTSKAMRSYAGAWEPDYGTLFDDMFLADGDEVPRHRMAGSLVELELAFILRSDLRGPGVNVADVVRAVDWVVPSIEVVYSRQRSLPNLLVDSISDAAACGYAVLSGRPARIDSVDIRDIGATLSINGNIEESGVARAVMGNPVNAVAWLVNKLGEFGEYIEAGHTVLSGAFIKAVPYDVGDDVRAVFSHGLGEIGFRAV
jgi:2-oxo-hept-3-ene-1,7-dioate hydratase/2-keto-4-pentenoate hydratase